MSRLRILPKFGGRHLFLSSGTQSASNGITTTTANTNGILGGYATVGGTDWASSTGTAGNITAYSAYTGGNLGVLAASGTLNVEPTGAQPLVASAKSFYTLNLTGSLGVSMSGAGALTVLGGGLIGNTSGTISSGTLAGTASGELIVITPANLTIGSVIANNGGATGLTKAGSGTLTLTGGNTYSGATTIGAGVLQVSGSGRLGTGTVTDNSVLVLTSPATPTFSGAIGGVGSLTQAGTGTVTLTGSNTFTGGTNVNAGLLMVNGSLASPVTVNVGGILGGTGSLTSVTVNGGGQLAPGNAPGILNLSGDLTLEAGAIMDYDLDTPSTSDLVLMPTGELLLSGQQFSDWNFTHSVNFAPGVYPLIDAESIGGSLGRVPAARSTAIRRRWPSKATT